MIQPDNFKDRNYVIIDVTDVGLVDFSQVLEASSETLRKNSDSTQTFVKYDGTQPSSVATVPSRSQEYTYDQFKTIILGADWILSTPEDI